MNLHIAPDNVFTNRFYENLSELNVLEKNKIIVRSHEQKLRYIKHDIPFAKLYSNKFNGLIGDTAAYEKVFIHQFTPLLYQWVATNKFQELNWMVWGADLYNLPFIDDHVYEPITYSNYVKKNWSLEDLIYKAKVYFFNRRFKDEAYSKVKHVLTWMEGEYRFAKNKLPSLSAKHQFFFYENELPYSQLDDLLSKVKPTEAGEKPAYILGNAANPVLNHVDAVYALEQKQIKADLKIPVSYGFPAYTKFLRKELSFYTGGSIEFIDQYMTFQDYLNFLSTADGMIMNSVRPQGYGNIFLMQYMAKPVYFNLKNISLPDLTTNNIVWRDIDRIPTGGKKEEIENKEAVVQLLSHARLLKTYQELFS